MRARRRPRYRQTRLYPSCWLVGAVPSGALATIWAHLAGLWMPGAWSVTTCLSLKAGFFGAQLEVRSALALPVTGRAAARDDVS